VAKVTTQRLQRVVESVGTLYPYDETIISAEIEGRVKAVKVDLGDHVVTGQVLVEISEEEQKYLVAQTEAQLRAILERLGLQNENERLSDVRQAPDVRRAQADLTEAEQRYRRVKELTEQGIGSRQDFDQAASRYKAAQAAYDAAINQTRNLVQEAERARAQLELQRKKLRDTTVRAPYSGSVKERHVTVGAYVRPNAPLITLVKTDPLRLRLEIPERMAPWIHVGQIAEVSVEAYQDRKFSGKVWRISPTVDQTKRTFIVEALISNPHNELKAGSYARARVPTSRVEEVKVVPIRAVAYVFGSNKAFVVKDRAVVEAREVKVGDRFDQKIEILEGLNEGELVAVTQVNRLDTGTRVTIAAE
jgi:RND family efflux transporter MFP subunit